MVALYLWDVTINHIDVAKIDVHIASVWLQYEECQKSANTVQVGAMQHPC